MGNISITNTLSNGTVVDAAKLNTNFTDITSVVNGNVDGTNISSSSALTVATLTANTSISTDTIAEKTSATGVTIDGVLIKDTLNGSGIVALAGSQTLTGKKTMAATVQTVTASADGATVTFDVSLGNIHTVTLGGNRTLAISNETAGQCFIIEITQDGTGSRTVTWFTTIKWAGGSAPTLTTTASKRDVLGFRVTGTDTYDGFIIGQNV